MPTNLELRTIEGTWEEICGKAKEFAGHRIRLTILEPPTSPVLAAHVSTTNVVPKVHVRPEPQKRNHSLVAIYD